MTSHPLQRRYFAEDLVRLRRSDEQRRYAAPQRAARIDANPHQIEAVIFALGRIPDGGCILADEVGLGKTIETGLVVAQLLCEGASRVLLVTPKSLLGQWKQELATLFDIDANEGERGQDGFVGPGVFLVGREYAGSEKGRAALMAGGRFDLCVIDEAHELFAGIYRRFDKIGEHRDDSPHAMTASRVKQVLQTHGTPVLLLTATPIQNNLAELWGLVHYVDPLGTLLGQLHTFRELFCAGDDRVLASGQEDELRSRIKSVMQRTLRRQAQDFLEKPFVNRQARLFEYRMSPEEKALYDEVTAYLLEPGIVAFQGNHRHLLLIGFHRRMASSTRALSQSLTRVAQRLERLLDASPSGNRGSDEDDARSLLEDLEEAELDVVESAAGEVAPSARYAFSDEQIRQELERVQGFVRRAEQLTGDDSKFRALLQALTFVTDRAKAGSGAGKLVIFTESRVTQTYLRDRLCESGLVAASEITLFSGKNDSAAAGEALRRWQSEVPQGQGPSNSGEMAVRLALVHEFATRSRVFISTEAGAKGLNLQFCDTLVNYDLPWNPQRIEQRIGRCHRYGQRHDVTVINFLAKDNEAQQLTLEILTLKLELFGNVLDASDQVLHRANAAKGELLVSALGAEFEGELRKIWERARTIDEVTAELRSLRERVTADSSQFEETHARTAQLIEEHLDEGVRSVLRMRKAELPQALADFDDDLLRVVTAFLDAEGIGHAVTRSRTSALLSIEGSPALPSSLRSGGRVGVGAVQGHASLSLRHELVTSAVAQARHFCAKELPALVELGDGAPQALLQYRGCRGRLRLVKLAFDGFERVERLVPVVVLDGVTEPVKPELGHALLHQIVREGQAAVRSAVTDEDLEDATEGVVFEVQREVDEAEQRRFEHASQRAQRFLDDRLLVLRRRRGEAIKSLRAAEERRDAATGSEARTDAEQRIREVDDAIAQLDASIEGLVRREDKTFELFQEQIHRRRFTPPRIEQLCEAELVIA